MAPASIVSPPHQPGLSGQETDDVGSHVRGDPLQGGVLLHPGLRAPDEAVAGVQHSGSQRRVRGPALQTWPPVRSRSGDRAIGDIRMADMKGVEKGVVGGQQAFVAPPILGQREPATRQPGCVQVGIDVGASEGVDGLLRIADQHQGGLAVAEGPTHHLPLHRVGVLELVDENDPVPIAEQPAGLLTPLADRRGCLQADEEVVVGQQVAVRPAGEPPPCGRPRPGGAGDRGCSRRWRLEGRDRIGHGDTGDLVGRPAVEGRDAPAEHPSQKEVVDHFVDGVAGVLDQRRRPTPTSARHTQAGEDQMAEAVGGRDGGRIEDRPGHRVSRYGAARSLPAGAPRPSRRRPGPRRVDARRPST